MERMKKLKLANTCISKLKEIKNLFLSKPEINFSESLKNNKILNSLIMIKNTHFRDIDKQLKKAYIVIEQGDRHTIYRINDREMIESFSEIEKLLYEIIDISTKIKVV